MTDFDKIKQFFVDHTNKYVNYKVVESNELKAQRFPDEYTVCNIFNNKQVVDFFAIEFSHISNPPLVDVESLDSFAFCFYFCFTRSARRQAVSSGMNLLGCGWRGWRE